MEAWKFLDYSNLSPVYALSFTAEQWGLEPFPGNLIATTEYWQDIGDTNASLVPVWTLPYSCPSSDNNGSFLDYDYYDINNPAGCGYNDSDGCSTNFSLSANICATPQPCGYNDSDSCSTNLSLSANTSVTPQPCGCLVLVEGILKTTTGPLNTPIVPLVHGITCLFILIFALAIIMGCVSSTVVDTGPPRPVSEARLHQEVQRHMNPPPPPRRQHTARVQTYAEREFAAAGKALEVAQASELLRQMYALDLTIWAMQESVEEERPRREEMMRNSNALFAEIQRRVQVWRAAADAKWSAEEQELIENICAFMETYNVQRYRL